MKNKRSFLIIFLLALNGFTNLYAQKLLEQKTKTIEISKQKFIQDEGFIEVLENRDKPASKVLKLPVRIIKSSSNEHLEPVFYLDGGPGYSNLGTTQNTEILQNHDFVFVGYRGADGTCILNNKKLHKAFKGKNSQLLGDESLDHIVNTMQAYFNDLEKQGTDVSQYTIMQVIDDLEQARMTLGYDKINLLSFSYGTRVALLYSYKYPNSIHRSVVAGANPPGHFLWYPEKTEEILNIWEEKYKAQGMGSLKEAIQKSFDNMPEKWSFYKLDSDKIKTVTFLSMSQVEMAVKAFEAFYRAAGHHDYSGLYLMQLLYDVFMKKVIWGDMYAKGASADMQFNTDYRAMLRAYDKTTVLGANMSLVLWGSIQSWNKNLIPEEYQKPMLSQTETLIVSGDLDTSTPTDYAHDELMPFLPNGHQVILNNFSHADIAMAQPQNYFKLINNFYDTGKIDASVFSLQTIDFNPKRKFHKIAKWGFPVIMVMGWFN
jgi:pimeloyl-ACP methyl ester carboxylesterase